MASTIPTASKDALQIALMGGLSPEALQTQRAFGNRQMLEGTSGAPVQHWTQGLNRVAQGVVGGLRERDSRQQEQQAALLNREAIMKAMNGGSLEDSAGMLMGNPATSDMGMKLAQSAISSRQQQAQASAAQQARIEAENRAFERQKELIKYKSQFGGDGSGSYGKAGTIVQGPNGQFYSVQFGSDGTRRILPLTFEQAQAEGMLGDGWQGVRGGDQPQAAQAVPLSPAKGVSEVDTGTGTLLIDKATGQPISTVSKDLIGAESQKALGKSTGEAQAMLPKIEDSAFLMLKTIDQTLQHPGKTYGLGIGGLVDAIPNTEQAGFVSLVKQIQGKTFLEAFNSLRGGGQITEAEGKKATDALARLSRVQRTEDFDAALRDLREVVEMGVKRARQQAGVTGQPGTGSDNQGQAKTFVFDPATGELRPK